MEQAHFIKCENQPEGSACICEELQEARYYATIDAQLEDLALNLI